MYDVMYDLMYDVMYDLMYYSHIGRNGCYHRGARVALVFSWRLLA
jgi:hypothetical protein